MARIVRYRVYFTPVANANNSTYATEVDVSDRITIDGIGSIKKSIDSSDYDIGLYFYSDLTLKGQNHNGYFNESDFRSIFPAGRDRCKVRVVWTEADDDGVETEFVTYRGIINEEATRLDIANDAIQFKVLSRDSVLRNTKVSGGTITNSMTVRSAMQSILNVPAITSVLTFDSTDINPDLNFTINDGSYFNNLSVRDAMNKLLLASNSVMVIDSDGTMIVKARVETEGDVLQLYGKSETYGRENIISIKDYNEGKHRMFTAVTVNDNTSENTALSQAFGYRVKTIELPFITTDETEIEIADRLVDEFSAPKKEVKVQISMAISKELDLLDPVSIDYPLRVKPRPGTFLPVVDITAIGDATMPLPDTFGSISIDRNTAFKIIEIEDNPKDFTSTLKLRQIGTTLSDGVFNSPTACAIVDIGIIELNVVCTGGDDCDKYEDPSIIGGATVGCGLVA